jgi:Peptidase family M28
MERAERYAADAFAAAGWRVRRDPFDVRWTLGSTDRYDDRALPLKVRLHPRLAGANLTARHPDAGSGPAVLVAAHLDTVEGSPGADDNASGVAVVLETARLLGGLPQPPAVTLLLTDLEEAGLVGARIAARRHHRDQRPRGVICLESVGCYAFAPHTQRLPAGAGLVFRDAVREVGSRGYRGDFALVVHRRSSYRAAALWRSAAAATGPALPAVLLRDPRPAGALGFLLGLAVPALYHLGRSDHVPFWYRGIPALLVTGTADFRNRHYHRATDTPDTLDYPRLAAVAVATAVTVARWPAR